MRIVGNIVLCTFFPVPTPLSTSQFCFPLLFLKNSPSLPREWFPLSVACLQQPTLGGVPNRLLSITQDFQGPAWDSPLLPLGKDRKWALRELESSPAVTVPRVSQPLSTERQKHGTPVSTFYCPARARVLMAGQLDKPVLA